MKDHTSFLAFGRSKRIFSANRSWVEFFTQTLDLEGKIQKIQIRNHLCTVKTNSTSFFFENCTSNQEYIQVHQNELAPKASTWRGREASYPPLTGLMKSNQAWPTKK